jgi:hypothetical protein
MNHIEFVQRGLIGGISGGGVVLFGLVLRVCQAKAEHQQPRG